jgi:hypothetical protein
LKSLKSTLKSLISVLDRESRVAHLWGQVASVAAPLQNPSLQEFPEVCSFWCEYELVESQVKELLGEAAFAALARDGKIPSKPKSQSAMKGILTALNSGMGERVLTKTVSSTFKSLSSSSTAASSRSKEPADAVSPKISSPSLKSASSPTMQTAPLAVAIDAGSALQKSIALVEFNGAKSKLAIQSDCMENLIADVREQLRTPACSIEFEDADFPGHFLPIEQLPQPIPAKLILRVFPYTQPPATTNSGGVGFGHLNFSIPFSELSFIAPIGKVRFCRSFPISNILNLYSQGSYGQVHRGIWRGQDVAIKESITLSELARGEFLSEVQLMCNLRPHVRAPVPTSRLCD